LYATVPNAFENPQERALCELFAGQVAVTLAGAQRHAAQVTLSGGLRGELDRLLEADRQRTRTATDRQRRLAGLIESLTAPLTFEQVGRVVLDAAAGGTTAGCAALLTYPDLGAAARRLRLLAASGLPEAAQHRPDVLARAAASLLTHPGGPVLLPAAELAERDPRLGELFAGHLLAAVPLYRDRQTLGVLLTAHPGDQEPDSDAVGYLLTVAQLATAALERARLATAEHTAASRLELLARASAELVGSVTRNRALPTLTRALVPQLADWASVHLLAPDGTLALADVRTADPDQRGRLRALLHAVAGTTGKDQAIDRVAREQQPALYPEVTADVLATLTGDPELAAQLAALNLTALAILPMSGSGGPLGVVTLGLAGRRLEPADVALADEITRRAAISLDNTHLYAQARDAALALQRSLLPDQLPQQAGLHSAARYLPGTTGLDGWC